MSSQGFAQFIPLILIFVIFYFFLIRPQQKKSKRSQGHGTGTKKRGDEVITSGGIIGIVDKVYEDDKIDVILGENVKVQIIKTTITSLLKKKIKKNKRSLCLISQI